MLALVGAAHKLFGKEAVMVGADELVDVSLSVVLAAVDCKEHGVVELEQTVTMLRVEGKELEHPVAHLDAALALEGSLELVLDGSELSRALVLLRVVFSELLEVKVWLSCQANESLPLIPGTWLKKAQN